LHGADSLQKAPCESATALKLSQSQIWTPIDITDFGRFGGVQWLC
jgi:hypothetical protein